MIQVARSNELFSIIVITMINEKNTGGYHDLVHAKFCTRLGGKLAEKLTTIYTC